MQVARTKEMITTDYVLIFKQIPPTGILGNSEEKRHVAIGA